MATTAGGLRLVLPPCFHHRRTTTLRIEQRTMTQISAALSKHGHRFLTSVATTDDPATTARLIRKFIASSSKSVALDAISHLVSPVNTSFSRLSPLALPLYYEMSKASWFNWNAKLIADIIASLHNHQRFHEAQTLVLEVETQLARKEREICNFYCNLMESHSKHQSKHGILDSYERIKQLPSHSSSIYIKKRSYASIIACFSVIDLPNEAKALMVEMKNKGLRPSVFQYRSLYYAYGRLGLFVDMERVIDLMENEGFDLDVVSSNMVLSSLGFHNELEKMVLWLRRMKSSKIPFSIRTYNSVLNHCPTITSIVEHPKEIKPMSLKALLQNLKNDESTLVQELVDPLVLDESTLVQEREICNFYCNLMESHSKHQSKHGILDSYERIKQLPSHSSSIYIKKRSYASIIACFSVIDLPNEAEALMVEMKNKGLTPSVFQYRSLYYAYGRLGLFVDMERVIDLMENEGFDLDVVSSNMVLSSLGFHNELEKMVLWLRRMKSSKIPFSIRTYNSVLNHCPTITSIVEHPKEIKPMSLKALLQNLKDDESTLVQELVDPLVLDESMELTSLELKLDLHGMHMGSAYLILLQWFDDIRIRYGTKNHGIPNNVTVVCGIGKHSVVRGESPVKELVKEMMRQMKSPLKIDRKNVGCFVAHGKVFMNWLCQSF